MKILEETEMVFIEVEKYLVPENVEFYKLVDGKLRSKTEIFRDKEKADFTNRYFSGIGEGESITKTTENVVNLVQRKPILNLPFLSEKKIICGNCKQIFYFSVHKQVDYTERGETFPVNCYRCIRKFNTY